ncbi:deleted in malignant brain tumors 1 protein-like [Heptranchias perlo]|uniref:deleted in malignant brain tumors 1 protein-like n=1 Tax=Heptranchias perlo TaxID=212740 RepID=UPI00355A8201
MADVVVVCRQMNCGFAELAQGSATFGEGTEKIWLDDVKCEGSEATLAECTLKPLGQHNCNHREDAGVVCNQDQPPKPSISLNRVSNTFVKGEKVLIQCLSLGFYKGAVFFLYKDDEENHIASKVASARGNSATFTFSKVDSANEANYSCTYEVEVSGRLYKSAKSEAANVVVREQLLKPTIYLDGQLQVLMKGLSFDIICEAPDYFSGARFYLYKGSGGDFIRSQNVQLRLDRVKFRIQDISKADDGNYSCEYQAQIAGESFNSSRSEDVPVTVVGRIYPFRLGSDPNKTHFQRFAGVHFSRMLSDDVALRLVDGENDCLGTVQVYYNETWGSVCADSWDIADVQVVCRQLGCGFAQRTADASSDVQIAKPIWLSTVRCSGAETHLWVCPSRAWTSSISCGRSNSAKVSCSAQPPQPLMSIVGTGVVFKGDTIQFVCSAHFLYNGASMSLYKMGEANPLLYDVIHSNKNAVTFSIANINNTHDGTYWCNYQIEVSELVFVSENSESQEITVVEDSNIRIVDGPNSCSGRVEVYYNGSWGTICDSGWGILDAEVVCNQLGCGFGQSATFGGHFGEGTGPVLLDNVRCNGSEPFLWSCASLTIGPRSCRQKNDAGVICSDEPQSPEINVLRTSGTFARGESLSIQCTALSHYTAGTFHLQKVGESAYTSSMAAGAKYANVTFIVEDVKMSQGGYYTCMYQLERQGRLYNSTKSDRVKIDVIEQPSKPSIQLFRTPGIYTIGEYLSIRCTAPMIFTGLTFLLLKMDGESSVTYKTEPSAGSSMTFSIANLTFANDGYYACLYQLKRAGKLLSSTQSARVKVSVTDQLMRPSISVLRSSASFVGGEAPNFRCSASSQFAVITFYLYRVGESGSITSVGPISASTAILGIHNVSVAQEGLFTCMFTVIINNRLYSSTHSDRVKIIVSSETERPSISVRKAFDQYPQGQLLSIVCTAPNQYRTSDFHLYKSGVMLTARRVGSSSSAEFSILNTSMADEGDYTCTYRTIVSGREYNSSHSDPLQISVAASMEQRLANGSSPCSGRVEILFGDSWGTICDDQWGLLDAKVVCQTLGCGSALAAPTHAHFGRGIGPIWMDDVACRGDESALWHCVARSWSQHNCHHGEDAGAICSGIKPMLALEPNYHIFVKGESVNLNCTTGDRNSSRAIDFYKNDAYLSHQDLQQGINSAIFQITNLTMNDTGRYSCKFRNQVAGKYVNSSLSDTVHIAVTDPLPNPKIRLFTLDGQTFINCTAENTTANSKMYLFEIGLSGPRQVQCIPMPNSTSIFPLNEGGKVIEGHFACLHQAQVRGRWVNSSYTESVVVAIPESSNVGAIVGWLLATLILLLILVVSVYYFRKSRTGKSKREYRIYVRQRLLDDVTHIEAIDDDTPF